MVLGGGGCGVGRWWLWCCEVVVMVLRGSGCGVVR